MLELPRGLTPTQLTGGFGMPEARDLSKRIEDRYIRRLEAVPADARRLLLVAAAEPVGDPLLLQRACERLGVALSRVDATGGLLAIEERVTFRHPLARSAVYRSAGGRDRRAAHYALAQVTDRDIDPDRRAWHLAAAAAGPDEEVARELERSAYRAQARGGLAAAAAFLRRAVALTSDLPRRAERALAAAQASLGAGAFDVARALLTTAAAGPLDELGRARVDLLQAHIVARDKPGGEASLLLLRAAKKLETLDVRLSRDTYLEAWGAALYAGRFASPGGGLIDVSRAAAAAPKPEDPPLPSDLLLDGFILLLTEGRHAAAPVLRRALVAFGSSEVSFPQMFRWGWLATRAANVVWDYDSSLEIGTRASQLMRDSGLLELLAMADNACGQAAALGGDFATASSLAAEVNAVIEATGSRYAPLAELALAGVRGREAEASPLIAGIIAEAAANRSGAAAQYANWARSVLMNGLGRYEEAVTAASEASEESPELFLAMWALIELVEAATRTRNGKLAEAALARLGAQTEATETEWALGILARSRALLSEGDAAERLYCEAIHRLGRTRLRPDFARARLLYGEWLRRQHRRVDARAQLRAAHELFVTIGMEAFAERARSELTATGETVRRRTDETRDELTAQERHVARLARDGLSNPQIGAQLFLSPRTVEWHLRKVFAKLEIRSRTELANVLPDTDPRLASA
ncbi:MAG: LuxR C-terminal-related transcriptional regulator [Actinomycetota bacterium]|nr:LuxR C-terminal-related transcriptional regulator [Actinomycetota bacterium]